MAKAVSIKAILDEVAAESSTNEKMNILRKYASTPLLREVIYLAHSRRIKFYIRQIPEYKTEKETLHLAVALDDLKLFSRRELTGGDAKRALEVILSRCSKDDAEVVEKIIGKNLKMNMGSTNINKVFDKLIEKTPYMGAIPFSKEAIEALLEEGECDSEVKMDGRYCNAVMNGIPLLESREGNETYLPAGCSLMLELDTISDCVLNGELTIPGYPRYISNGIIASIISIEEKVRKDEDVLKEISEFKKKHGDFLEMADKIVFTAWDLITVEEYFARKSKVQREQRKMNLRKLIRSNGLSTVQMIRSRTISTYAEAMEHFYELLSNGEEGTVIKSKDGVWTNGKPTWQVKLKLEMIVDMEIDNFSYGTGKNEKVISSIITKSSDGKVWATPGGMDEKTMAYVTKNMKKLQGTIMEVKCAGLSKAKDGTYSLLHPRAGKSGIATFRDDKTKADSLTQIIKIENSIKGI